MLREKIGGGIEKNEAVNVLKEKLRAISVDLNKKFHKEADGENEIDFLDDQCRINMAAFERVDVAEDMKKVEEKKLNEFSIDTTNPKVIEHYALKGAESPEEITEIFNQEKENGLWNQQEMAGIIILNKYLPLNFVAVRTSEYDDFENGVDHLVINKITGEVICTIDEVSAPAGSERDLKKKEKIRNKIAKGGARVKYGLSYQNGKPVKEKISNIPVFNLRLSGADVKDLVAAICNGDGSGEKDILVGIIDTFIDQTVYLQENGFPEDMQKKILNFQIMLENWKKTL